jgi:hemolysin activation/secretion protein
MAKWIASVAVMAVLVLPATAWNGGLAAGESPPRSDTARVRVQGFRVTGSTVFRAEQLADLLRDAAGADLTFEELRAIAGRVTQYYRERGYVLARAVIPAQDIIEGVVEIAVIEGAISAVTVRGAGRYRPEHVAAFVTPPAGQPAVFHAGRHERGLLLLNDLPGLTVNSTIAEGAEVGSAAVVLDVAREESISGGIDVNNYGSSFTGRERFGFSFNLNNPLMLGDALSVRGVVSSQGEDLWLYRLGYSVPFGAQGTRAAVTYTRVSSKVGLQFRDLDVAGVGDVLGFQLTHPIVRTRLFTLSGQLGFDYKDFETKLLGETASRDQLRVLTLGGALEYVDPWRGFTQLGAIIHQGVGGLFGGLAADDDPNASRVGAGGTFTKLTGELSRLQPLGGPFSLFFRVAGQRANNRLVSPEQFAAGGIGTVRGYPIAELSGDHGYALTGELRANAPGFSTVPAFGNLRWGDVLQVFVFVDHGGVSTIEAGPGRPHAQDLTGAGVGVRLTIPQRFDLKMEYARSLGPLRPSDDRDSVLYFQGVLRF